MTQTYKQYRAEVKADQEGKTKNQIMDELSGEYKLDLDNLPKQQHNWIKRGIKVSCEGANHPYHSHFLVKR